MVINHVSQIHQATLKTLWSLARVNQTLYHASIPLLYRNLSLPISSRQKLQEDCAELEQHPFCKKFLAHSRCLKIWGRMPLRQNDPHHVRRSQSVEEYEPGDIEEYEAEFGDVFAADPLDGSADEVSTAWHPLVVVIPKCRHITDLIWVCKNQVPQCVLQAITQYHPSCRLEIRSFRLLSLREPIFDPHERDLVQSPCLHSISVKIVGRDAYGKADYNAESIFKIVALAPNLKHLNLVQPRIAAAPNALRNLRRPRQPWKGFMPPLEISKKGALESLTYSGRSGMSLEHIQEWSAHTDLSKLRFLMLGEISDPRVFAYMTRIDFACLETLDITLSPTQETRDLVLESATSCIQRLEPLQGLRVEGYLTSAFLDKVLQRHGQSLRRLALLGQPGANVDSSLSKIRAAEILKIEMHCHALEYLAVSIPSFKIHDPHSDPYDLCDICPSLPHLRELVLDIESPKPTLNTPSDGTIRQIWTLVNEKKVGLGLTRLAICNLSSVVSPAVLSPCIAMAETYSPALFFGEARSTAPTRLF